MLYDTFYGPFIGPRSYDYYLDSSELRRLRQFYKNLETLPHYTVIESDDRHALVYDQENGNVVLFSYWTHVADVTAAGRLVRVWDDWSATTAKHVKRLCQYCGISYPNKKEWLAMPTE